MRIYEGTPRQDYEEVLRSIGAFIDQRGMREILFTEAPDGFIIQGLVSAQASISAWSDPTVNVEKETLTFLDEDVSRFMEEAIARRNRGQQDSSQAGTYERALRVLGRYIDQQKPRDIFFFEQEGSYVLRLLMGTRAGARHVLAEFTGDELQTMVQHGAAWRAGRGQARQRPAPG
jgi:S-adenosylmethionine:diacylglycerol 3-amino-3-carboxypropyl transferase